MAIDTLCIIGVGLIGGSIAAAARRQHPGLPIVGVAPPAEHEQIRAAGLELELYDDWAMALAALGESASLGRAPVILATPPSVTMDLLPKIASQTEAVITDVCSVKRPLVEIAESIVGPARFVPGHPMAGSQERGAGHASPDLFLDKPVVLTPTARTDPGAVAMVEAFWELLGARVLRMEATRHDQAVARASHAVHALAAVAAGVLGGSEEAMALASTGYGDTTRVAGGDPDLWADILLCNAEAITPALAEARHQLQAIEQALAAGDAQTLRRLLAEAQQTRAQWQQRHND
jgi:prephenate dehydrogenase